MNPITN